MSEQGSIYTRAQIKLDLRMSDALEADYNSTMICHLFFSISSLLPGSFPNIPPPTPQCLDNLWCNGCCQGNPEEDEDAFMYRIRKDELRPHACYIKTTRLARTRDSRAKQTKKKKDKAFNTY